MKFGRVLKLILCQSGFPFVAQESFSSSLDDAWLKNLLLKLNNDIQYNDIQLNDIQHNGIQLNDILHKLTTFGHRCCLDFFKEYNYSSCITHGAKLKKSVFEMTLCQTLMLLLKDGLSWKNESRRFIWEHGMQVLETIHKNFFLSKLQNKLEHLSSASLWSYWWSRLGTYP